jgi:hypothetical protein
MVNLIRGRCLMASVNIEVAVVRTERIVGFLFGEPLIDKSPGGLLEKLASKKPS